MGARHAKGKTVYFVVEASDDRARWRQLGAELQGVVGGGSATVLVTIPEDQVGVGASDGSGDGTGEGSSDSDGSADKALIDHCVFRFHASLTSQADGGDGTASGAPDPTST